MLHLLMLLLISLSTGSPAARSGFAMAYDPENSRIVVYGGQDSEGRMDDTWSWNQEGWRQIPSTGPGTRVNSCMAFDGKRILLFGGLKDGKRMGDTWGLENNKWVLLSEEGPSPRSMSSMAFDESRETLVLFGGKSESVVQDTWEWDAEKNSWTLVAENGPAARGAHELTFDETKKTIVLYGGYSNATLNDCWEWDGNAWTETPIIGSPSRLHFAMAYSDEIEGIVLFGGFGDSTRVDDVWAIDKRATRLDCKGPIARAEHEGVFFPGVGFVVFGGIVGEQVDFEERVRTNEIWIWKDGRWNNWNEKQPEELPLTFMKTFGENGKTRGVTVETTEDGGYILTGYTTEGHHGSEDVLLIKTDQQGQQTWRKTFGGTGNDNGWAVRQTRDGGYIIIGFTNSFGAGEMDVYLLKVDSNGEKVWDKTFGGPGDDHGWDVRLTNDGGFIIAAESTGREGIDAQLIKVDENGEEIWSETYGGKNTDRVFSVQQMTDGGYIAAGISNSFSQTDRNRCGYLVKTDSNGRQLWKKTFGEDRDDVAHSVANTEDGGLLVTGYGQSYSVNGGTDLYLMKTDAKGQTQWLKPFGGPGNERGLKGQQTSDKGYIAIGFTSQGNNVLLLKSDSSGKEQWTRFFGTPNQVNFGYTVKPAGDGGYIIIGHEESANGNSSRLLLIKTDQFGLLNE